MSNFAPKRTTYGTTDRRWARNFLALDTHDVNLNGAEWPEGEIVPSGTHVAEGGVPYTGIADEGPASVGLLVNDWRAAPGKHLVSVASGGGPVDRRYLQSDHDTDAEAALTAINFIN